MSGEVVRVEDIRDALVRDAISARRRMHEYRRHTQIADDPDSPPWRREMHRADARTAYYEALAIRSVIDAVVSATRRKGF